MRCPGVILSIDLAASEKNDTGIALLARGRISTLTVRSDEEIITLAAKHGPSIIGIDAPLSIPKGRKTIDDRAGPHFRECDLKLRGLGIRFFPITIGAMRTLTKRGMALKGKLAAGLPRAEMIEIFPGASFDMLGIERKNINATNRFLKKFHCDAKNVHESDAAIGAYTLLQYSKKKALMLGGKDGGIVIPRRTGPRSP